VSAYVEHYTGARRQNWTTPRDFFLDLHREYGFTMDGASEPGNGHLDRASTADAPLSWIGERVFCNPPWSSIPPFVELAAVADLAVLLVPARTNCGWFHRALELDAVPRFFKGKLRFGGAKWNSPVDCLLLVFASTTHE
jgi:hypothetical protein